ncbi:MAG: MipA/OmpV family protein [Cardiobacteriaceae bacterium]|nr:MipA/OmpV family protein [Cardiobacteriaceae bacterium]
MKKFAFYILILLPGAAAAETPSLWGDKTKVTLGASAGIAPEYMGADDMRAVLVPQVNVSRGIFFADSRRGIGVQYRNDNGFAARTAIAYEPGRSEKAGVLRPGSKDLRGMGEIDASALWNIALAQDVTPWLTVNGEANIHLGGQKHRGHDFRIGVEGKVLANERDTLKVNANLHGGNSDYQQTWFGVSPAQAARSAFPAFKAGKGIHAVSAGAAWERQLDAHWTLGANVQWTQITGDAKDSPLVREKSGVTALGTVKYAF